MAGTPPSSRGIASGATAGGDLTGTYPDPTVAAAKITPAKLASGAAQPLFDGAAVIWESLARPLNRDSVVLASGTLRAAAVGLRAGQTVTSVTSYCNVASAVPTLIRFGIYDSTFALVASTTSDVTLMAGVGVQTKALTAPFVVVTSGIYYVAILVVAGAAGQLGGLNAGVSGVLGPRANGSYAAFIQAALANLPDPAVPATTDGFPWFELI